AARQGIPLRDALTHVQITSFGTSVNMNGSQFSERVERVFHIVNGQSVEMGK
ncbi:hypothetical protein HY091_02400, partial [Candidatus Kaiserbacteria bacterium]|nr:hypothetical protein [Candidatus Kaiserbacteria bacterium]